MPFASAIASSSSENVITGATGPKVSSVNTGMSGSTSASTVAGKNGPSARPPATTRAPPRHRHAR